MAQNLDWGLGIGDWGLGIGDWVQKIKLSSIDYLAFSVLELVSELCAEIHKGTRSKILKLVCSVRAMLVNT
jgi:hypothetical protein